MQYIINQPRAPLALSPIPGMATNRTGQINEMKTTVNFSDFLDAFTEDRKNQFSYEGKRALFDYLEEYEEVEGEQIELDIVSLCCDWTEYDSFEDYKAEYGDDRIKDIEYLKDKTSVIEIPDTERFLMLQY